MRHSIRHISLHNTFNLSPSIILNFYVAAVNIKAKSKAKGKYEVEYDNGETEDVLMEHLAPIDVPVEFSAETIALQVRLNSESR